MPAMACHCLGSARKALPYVWGFAIASAIDHVIDIRYAFPSALLALAVLSAGAVVLRRGGR